MQSLTFQVSRYLRHWLLEVDEHSLHAPFAYEIYQNVLLNKHSNYPEIPEILRQELLNNHSWIETMDLGAGSRVNTGAKKKISKVARHELSTKRFSQVLFDLIRYKNYQNILELGTSLGVNTSYLSLANEHANVWTIEGCPSTAGVARENFQKYNLTNIKSLDGNADDLLSGTLEQMRSVDLAYLDANHTYEATVRYFNMIRPFLSEGAVIIFDDIYWSSGMEKAWNEICESMETGLGIDLYVAGMLFFTKGPGMERIRVKF